MTVELRRPEACSILSAQAAEPLAATAPHPKAWLALEQPGPWGRKAPSSSHLDRELGAELDRRAKAAGVTFVLVRRPGRHADHHDATRRTLLASHPGAGWLEQGIVDDPRTLLDLDLAALAAGGAPGLGRAPAAPIILICTNGRRDLCCAEVGRARVTALAPVLGDSLWESSHLGGHRFSPTVLLLPSGIVLGRASADDVLAAVAGDLPLHVYRGRTSLAPAAQAAEAWALGDVGSAEQLTVGEPIGAGPWQVAVSHADGRAWEVVVEAREGLERPESCGREAEPYLTLEVTGARRTAR